MSTITIDVPEEIKVEVVEKAAKMINLSPNDFIQLAVLQSVARILQDPRLEQRTKAATGKGWEQLKRYIPDVPPQVGDELPE